MKFVDALAEELQSEGFTHCFMVAGGNVMHLVEACRTRFHMVPVVHEVAAVIGAEYFNETALDGRRAFAVVTAGPGLTNAITGIAGAWLESRDVLVLGGQVKSEDLARNGVRQLGIQEIDGVSLARPITKAAVRIDRPVSMAQLRSLIELGRQGRPGPVFLELCLDAQAAPAVEETVSPALVPQPSATEFAYPQWREALHALASSERPLILLGGGVSRAVADAVLPALEALGIPTAVTWNAMDRIPAMSPIYAGRPNTWGMRWANLVIQQADMIVAIGTRLGLQQTGFAWRDFAPLSRIAQVDLDPSELNKGRPHVTWKIQSDAGAALQDLVATLSPERAWTPWRDFVDTARRGLPLVEEANLTSQDDAQLVPQVFVSELADLMDATDILIPCSSGGAFTVAMQVFENKRGQLVVSNKALASMGYGLSGAIGAALANPRRRVVLTEGDGGFAQNLQELGTVASQGLTVKMFVVSNRGYASIRMTQLNYFNGGFVGCDPDSGLGLPKLEPLATAWAIPYAKLHPGWQTDPGILTLMAAQGPAMFEVPVSQEQSYWPKIGSRVLPDGSMASAPLHLMSPALPADTEVTYMPYFTEGENR